jgi:elongation factor 1-gamma
VNQWIDFGSNEIEAVIANWIYPIYGIIPYNKANVDKSKADLKKTLEVLNNHLLGNTFLVGEHITLADIAVCCSLYSPFTLLCDPSFRAPFGNVLRWFNTLVNQPQFVKVLGTVKLAEQEAKPQAAAGAAKEEKKKEEKKEAPKKEAPKKAAKEEDEEEEDDTPKEEKPKGPHWTDSLAPTTMVMDAWKRCYSNNDTRGVAMPEFWKMFDPSGYSLWFCHYKFQDELEKVFMTANLISGFFQRLDRARKFSFGNVLIFGQEPKLEIHGIWLFRGQEVPPEVKECDDCELYEWVKITNLDDATKALVEDYWAWDGNLGGKKFVQGKTFK